MLSTEIPIFPLPNVVLFPGVFLPLHIFEQRYRKMLETVLAGDRMIGITLLRPGWNLDAAGRPSIFAVGCAGLVTHVEQIEDGRYNIVLRGLEKFRVAGEGDEQPYRVARVEYLVEQMSEGDRTAVRRHRDRLEQLLAALDAPNLPFPSTLSDEEVVNALAQYLDLEPIERQALLERHGVAERGEALIDLLEMRSMAEGHPPDRGLRH